MTDSRAHAAARRAIETALSNAEDNLHRATRQQAADPEWTSGNDEPIQDLIDAYRRERDDLRAALRLL